MPEQPFYKHCEFCGHYIQTATSKAKRFCTRYPQYIDHDPDDTCGEWICARCWIPWDMVVMSDEGQKVNIVDHTKCTEIGMQSVELKLEEEDAG